MTSNIESLIQNYLSNGGAFNPELMEHEKVRDLIILCRVEITALKAELKAEREAVDFYANCEQWITDKVGSSNFFKLDEDIEQIGKQKFAGKLARSTVKNRRIVL